MLLPFIPHIAVPATSGQPRAFANLYKDDPFECLRATLKKYGAPLPEEPAKGTLNPADIAHAEYLFA